jgi:hypothetical protein
MRKLLYIFTILFSTNSFALSDFDWSQSANNMDMKTFEQKLLGSDIIKGYKMVGASSSATLSRFSYLIKEKKNNDEYMITVHLDENGKIFTITKGM